MKIKYLPVCIIYLLFSSCDGLKKIIPKPKPKVQLSRPQVTSSAKELIRITSDVLAEFSPCLSPNGDKLLYTIKDEAKISYKQYSIRLKNNINTPGFTPLIGDGIGYASWINKEGGFVFTYGGNKPVIATSNVNKLGITYVGQNAYGDYDNHARTSPDGQKIALTTTLQGVENICLVKTDGSNFTVLSEGTLPFWKPDGKKILYTKKSGEYFQLFELDLTSYQSTQITTGSFNSFNGCYSSNGESIAFISDKDNGYNHLFIMNSGNNSISQLTGGDSTEADPFWGSDNFIYFSSNAGARTPDNTKINPKRLKYCDIWRVKPLMK